MTRGKYCKFAQFPKGQFKPAPLPNFAAENEAYIVTPRYVFAHGMWPLHHSRRRAGEPAICVGWQKQRPVTEIDPATGRRSRSQIFERQLRYLMNNIS